jgi:parallel beta-helix repeat protein
MFFLGVALAAAAAWLSRSLWRPQPAPVVIVPRILVVQADGLFSTIQDALAQAHTGDIVEVAPGDYRGPVQLKSGVTVRSQVPRQAILRLPDDASGPAIVAQGIRGARVAGLHIAGRQAAMDPGIELVDSQVELDDTEIDHAATGVAIRGSASPVLVGNSIHDCSGEGILISGPSSPRLSHNALVHNGRAGVAAGSDAHPLLVGNVFENNGVDFRWAPPAPANQDAVRESNFFLDTKPRGGRKR